MAEIKGYRTLSSDELNLINRLKQLESDLFEIINAAEHSSIDLDQKWWDDGKITLQKGFMSAVRAIAKPTS